MFSESTTVQMKAAMLAALKANFGVIARSAEAAGINRTTHYTWMDSDPDYKAAVIELKEYKKDFIESKLLKLINDGDVASTIFAAKTQLKDRGYIERTELTGADGKDLNYNVTLDLGGNTKYTIEPVSGREGE